MNNMVIEFTDLDRSALSGQVAVVTGAGQGIGRETARLLASLGVAVVIAEHAETGQETEHLIRTEGGQALFVHTDVSDPEAMERLHQESIQSFGHVDILVNNAEAFSCQTVLELTVPEWDRIFAVNLRGAFLGIKAFLPAMLQRRSGIIVTMQSADGMPYLAPYLASKVGLRSLAFSLAQEVGMDSGVWVYCFGAGMVETPGGLAAFRELAPRYGMSLDEFIRQSAPGGRLISAELCAAGMVGTILHAQQFHGEETDYVAGLALLGLAPTGERSGSQPPQGVETASLEPELIRQAVALNQQMEAIVLTNQREYAEQNMFVRPVVKRMFQQGTGLTVEAWVAQAEDMTRRLQQIATATPTTAGQSALDEMQLATYCASLQRMLAYITKQEGDARGWMKDPVQLHAALQALDERKQTVRQLIAVLGEMRQQGAASLVATT
jgi:NAD(P)-dependent dehydrogenase (short-subunit alcohol dehydrogenase family)